MSQSLDEKLKSKNAAEQQLWALRHTTEHVLHQAVKELYPDILLAMGPATDEGFYFDFDSTPSGKPAVKISESDFPEITKKMEQIIQRDLPLIQMTIPVSDARQMFADNPYKLEWIDEIDKRGESVSIFWTGKPGEPGSMVDLCSGPHIASTGKIKAFALLSVAGAYWHGDEHNKMLTRIYGTSFPSKTELDAYVTMQEEAKKRDHRRLGADLGLFTFSELVGKGLPLWTQKGTTIRRELERFIVDEEIARGYSHVMTPDIANLNLYRTSGHYPYYKDTMYAPVEIEDEEYMLRPMTCPHHFELYKSQLHSYRELPIRFAELAKLYRFEKSGELTGLMRVRSFCLADAHIIAAVSQAEDEINGVLDLIEHVAGVMGLSAGAQYRYRLSLGDRNDEKKYFKDDTAWDHAENVLRDVLVKRNAAFYEAPNEAAFYGPKIDVQMKNIWGKEETAFTVQYDFVMPKRFHLEYTGPDGDKLEPIVIHRSSIGAIERTIAFLIEFYAGAFPLWLAPVQTVLVPIAERHVETAEKYAKTLRGRGIRIEVDGRNESMQSKIREHTLQKVPYLGIIGDRESAAGSVSVRTRSGKDLKAMSIEDFTALLHEEIEHKR